MCCCAQLSCRAVSGRLAIAVLVSGAGTNLQALLDTVHGREAEIVAVASSTAGAGGLADRARDAAGGAGGLHGAAVGLVLGSLSAGGDQRAPVAAAGLPGPE